MSVSRYSKGTVASFKPKSLLIQTSKIKTFDSKITCRKKIVFLFYLNKEKFCKLQRLDKHLEMKKLYLVI